MTDFEEMDERTQELLKQVAKSINMSVQEVVERCGVLMQAAREAVSAVAEQIGDAFAELPDLPDLPRPPAEIKKDIKYEKNPMRLKQLNKELNESYKVYKRK